MTQHLFRCSVWQPGGGCNCGRGETDLEAAEERIADLKAKLAAARSALAAVREVREANR